LNDITVKDRYPLPLIQDLFDRLQGSSVFTKMDLRWGFNNVRIRESNEQNVAFITPRGLYEPTIMQFDLCNTLATFQRMIDDILVDEIKDGSIIVYVDDILVHTSMVEQNREMTRRVLTKLEENRLSCRAAKCSFERDQVDFLGVTILAGGLRVLE
jgi:hypothetical protein